MGMTNTYMHISRKI